jgi:hypothetical protein
MQETVQFRCATAEEAVHKVKTLLGHQVKPRDIEVISSEPIPELQSLITRPSHLPAFVISGAIIGIIAGFLLAAGTAWLYPLNTGGMPIVSFLPVGIVSYEAMMLCAVVFGVAGLMIETRKARRAAAHLSTRAISDGEILVFAQVASGEVAAELKAADSE